MAAVTAWLSDPESDARPKARSACLRGGMARHPSQTRRWLRSRRSCGSDDLFSHRLGLCEQIKVIRATGLRIGSRHVEAAERMGAHHRARALAVDVQVADVEVADGAVNLVARAGVDGPGQSELCVVGDFERMVEAASLDDGEHGPEDFFLLQL